MRNSSVSARIIVSAVAFILVIAVIFGGVTLYERKQQSALEAELKVKRAKLQASLWTEENVLELNHELYGFDHRVETFLFVGTDNSGSGNDDPNDYNGPMADFLLLMVIDHTENTIGYIEIDRNTITSVDELAPDGGVIYFRDQQICTAHWYGKSPEMAAENTVNAVKNYLGKMENIDGYFVINMNDIGTLNHTVGGVEVTIEDDLDATDSEFTKGRTLVLDDKQAEEFLRARMSVTEGQNAKRMERQRQYMGAFFDKVKQKTMENPKFGIEFFNMLKDVAVTNMNGTDFSRIAQKLLKGEDKGIQTIKGETKLGYVLEEEQLHEEFYPDPESVRDVMIDMFSLVHITADDLDPGSEDEDEDDEDYDDVELDDEEDSDEEDLDEEDLDEDDSDEEDPDDAYSDEEDDIDEDSDDGDLEADTDEKNADDKDEK